MRCEECGETMKVLEGQRYHYTESGLDNVILESVSVYTCPDGHEQAPIIPVIEELHAAIARAVALKPAPLTGAEVRFLRKELGYSARKWAALMRVDPATLSRWESDEQKIGTQSDLLTRLYFFRLYEEQRGRIVPGEVAGRVAAVDFDQPAAQMIAVNADNPEMVSYRVAGAM
jgi:putative transcriptional regulator